MGRTLAAIWDNFELSATRRDMSAAGEASKTVALPMSAISDELPVAICEYYVGLSRRADAGNHRAPIAAILLVMDDFDVRIFTCNPIGDGSGLIGTAIIDDDNFINIGDARKLGEKAMHHPLHVRFFIVRGQKDADAGEARR